MKTIKTFPFVPTNIDVQQIEPNKARISAYPFETGYGITIAHPIRRLLMSSSIGYAIVGVKINGVTHEFDSIRGITEDVSLFVINLRKLQFVIKNTEQTQIVVNYSFSGEKVLFGSDLKNDEVDVINPDVYLATINDDAKIEFSLIINKGIGYVSSEDIRSIILDTFIPVDAYFTPVKSVVYEIENVLVKDDPTFEKVIFDIETDGRISAIDAFKNAMQIMDSQMSIFKSELKITSVSNNDTEPESNENKILFQKLDVLNFSARCSNCLDKKGLKYIGELVLMEESELKSIKNLGKRSYDEIVDKVKEIGYQIGSKLPNNVKEMLYKKLNK
ncbi:DNA-directed RNA polymerase subunit alpha [Helicobacter sp. MIT 14-3879]|uniref:DNA-directed RNA polymerase subunit alpha n=1 Tax=Helicobacter sp. MIT 14-3879 TaxID=2040649 RepID=UPI000E1F9794|nr:DNA-directed RNA polymerase subunit alpha [Helicobacter sp. MIT 14-3879]RDU64140.1 DNA-directed RNA polymerase subunit alpha [Helicobacter sp. MIT 14-3879]